jgi:hypothetical protein
MVAKDERIEIKKMKKGAAPFHLFYFIARR